MKFVESTVRLQHASAPEKPIYMVGDSFGGCVALAVAARNPAIDLVLILVNPCQSLDCNFELFFLNEFSFLIYILWDLVTLCRYTTIQQHHLAGQPCSFYSL